MKFKKKNISYLILFSTSAIIISYSFFSIFSFLKKDTKKCIKDYNIEEKNNYKYLVKGDLDEIKVFENGNENPIYTFEKEIKYLPEYDQSILENGIYVHSDEELDRIMEDYED